MQAQFLAIFIGSISDSSSSANLSKPPNLFKKTELYLEGVTWDETGMALVLTLLVFNSHERIPFDLYIYIYTYLSLASIFSL